MKTILIPTGFSEASKNAMEYAGELAKITGAKIILFHAYYVPVPVNEYPAIIITPGELQAENEELLKKEADYLKQKFGVDTESICTEGAAIEEILTLAEQNKADLIIMGMTAAGKLSEIIIGSTTTDIISKSTIPVLAVPETTKFNLPKKIAFACDYKPETDFYNLDLLKEFSKIFNAEICIINVNTEHEHNPDKGMTGIMLENYMNQVPHLYYTIEDDDLSHGINEFIQKHGIDMVAMIPHKHNIWERLFQKSNTKKMAFRTHVPLLAIPETHQNVPIYFV